MIVESTQSAADQNDDPYPAAHIYSDLPDSKLLLKNFFQFFAGGSSGCMFAAMVAKNPVAFGWNSAIIPARKADVERELAKAVADPKTNTLSLIFPSITTREQLAEFLQTLNGIEGVMMEDPVIFEDQLCLAYRLKIGEFSSWITGFGPFEFLPKTRRTPYTSIALRVKPKPVYEWVMKPSAANEAHVADIDVNVLKEISKATFELLWRTSFKRVKMILGHSPDLKSAAKTTFNLPINTNDGK